MGSLIWELSRILGALLTGAVLLFIVQPSLFQSGYIPVTDVDISEWIGENYTYGAVVVFVVSAISALIWYYLSMTAKIRTADDVSKMRFVWWLIFLLPILAICAAIYFFNDSNEALLSLTAFYVIDILLLYWLATVLSSAKDLKFVPPFAWTIRHWFGLR